VVKARAKLLVNPEQRPVGLGREQGIEAVTQEGNFEMKLKMQKKLLELRQMV
jgi:hypothetical protein